MAHKRASWRMSVPLAAAALAALAGLAHADHGAAGVAGVIQFRGGAFQANAANGTLAFATFPAGRHVIVLDGPMTPARHAALEAAGVSLGAYLPTNAFIADVRNATPAGVRALPFVAWAGLYRKEWKVDGALLAGANGRAFVTPERTALAKEGTAAAYVWLFEDEPSALARVAINAIAGARVLREEQVGRAVCLSVMMRGADAALLADIPSVQFAEHMGEFTPRGNVETRWIVQTDIPNFTPLYDRGITGLGQVVGLIDFGINVNDFSGHCSFLDGAHAIGPLHRKVLAYHDTHFNDTHGTHCAGTLCGDAGVDDNTRGIAYGAKLVFSQYPQPTSASQYAKHLTHHNDGAHVHSNSWGDDSTRNYDSACYGLDQFLFEHDDDLIFFSVSDTSGPVRNPENAKNIMAVTASGSAGFEEQWCVGAGAATLDNRRKPEVAAPGCAVSSSYGSACDVLSLTGTSMACPAAAGAATLVRQYFTDGFYPTGTRTPANSLSPSGALLKAVLANSARDMTGEPGYPSTREGWGRVTIGDALGFAPDNRRMLLRDIRNNTPGALTTGGVSTLQFYVGGCAAPLRVTLAYHDAPGVVGGEGAQLVNNLDLVVTSPEGVVYEGNNFAGGVTIPGHNPDALNNLEQVLLPQARTGYWSATVLGTAVNIGAQGFALVVTGPVDQAACGTADFNCDGDVGTDQDIEAFFRALAGNGPGDADFNRDGDVGTDQDIESFFRVLAGGSC